MENSKFYLGQKVINFNKLTGKDNPATEGRFAGSFLHNDGSTMAIIVTEFGERLHERYEDVRPVTEVFRNFMLAEAAADDFAMSVVHQGEHCLGLQFLQEERAGRELMYDDRNMLRAIYDQTIANVKHNVMTNFIMNGAVRECVLVNHFMSTGEYWKNF